MLQAYGGSICVKTCGKILHNFRGGKTAQPAKKKEALGFLQIDEKTHSIRIGEEIKGNS